MSNFSIRVNNISKRYFIGKKLSKTDTSRWQPLNFILKPLQRIRQIGITNLPDYSDEVFWALKDITFDVKQGEILGIIGHNGAGKSTLLKILTRITKPTSGEAQIYGRVGSLLEVGTGFHPELTGRENIFLNGTILGMSRSEINEQFDEIVEFAGVGQFLDTPVKRYSSGMRVRLAFSVAAHLRVDIMLIDEVLAVGDAEFQRKCLGKMGDVANQGRTILFVSHNMASITALCTRGILLRHGEIAVDGMMGDVVSQYLHATASEKSTLSWVGGYAESDTDEFKIHHVQLRNHEDKVTDTLDARYPFNIEIMYEILQSINRGRVTIQITNSDGIMILHGYDIDNPDIYTKRVPGQYQVTCQIPGYLLKPGTYYLRVGADDQNVKVLAFPEDRLAFHISDTGAIGLDMGARRLGIIQPRLDWSQQKMISIEVNK